MQEEEVHDNPTGFAVWYGDEQISVLVDWSGCRVVATIRQESVNCWAVLINLPRWKAYRFRTMLGYPLKPERGSVFRSWYSYRRRRRRELAVVDVETFFEGYSIVDCADRRG